MDEEIKVTEQIERETEQEATLHTDAAEGEEETIGNIKISVEVVTTIAGIAATEIDGVSCMYTSFVGGVAERLGARKSSAKGVKVDMDGETANIDLYIVVDYGVKIPELAWAVQERVKASVENMTGLVVSSVNIHIEGINFNKPADTTQADTEEQA